MSKKILRGGIFKHVFFGTLDIELEGLDSFFHRSGLFIQIHFGVVCGNFEAPEVTAIYFTFFKTSSLFLFGQERSRV